jgi:hypothetical protein
MPRMTPSMIQTRIKWILGGIQQKTHRYSTNNHQKSYLKGYIHCVKCGVWIHPDDPEDAKKIILGKRGRRMHKDCLANSSIPAVFSTTPKFHGTRRKWLEQQKRY